jgi:hypothetical protein
MTGRGREKMIARERLIWRAPKSMWVREKLKRRVTDNGRKEMRMGPAGLYIWPEALSHQVSHIADYLMFRYPINSGADIVSLKRALYLS